MYGWMETILRIDLTSGKVSKEPLNMELAYKYIGGRGLNAKILYDEVPAGIDPLGPDNKLIIGVGPCNGTVVPGSQRFTVTLKSPITGRYADSNSGGSFGATLKYAGYDMVIVEGKAKELPGGSLILHRSCPIFSRLSSPPSARQLDCSFLKTGYWVEPFNGGILWLLGFNLYLGLFFLGFNLLGQERTGPDLAISVIQEGAHTGNWEGSV